MGPLKDRSLITLCSIAAATLVACVCLLTDCTKHSNDELTKRQFIQHTNVLEVYNPFSLP